MSELYIQIKYARIVGQTIARWVIKKDNPFHGNGKCHICGDSAKSSSKKRFHIIQHDECIFVKCFNCDYSSNLIGYLKTYHTNLFRDFIFEKYKDGVTENAPTITTPKVDIDLKPIKTASDQLFSLDIPFIKDLPKSDLAPRYVASRHLPDYPFQYAENFYKFSSQFNADLSKTGADEPRLVIPFFDRQGNVFAYQGRDLLGKSLQKYITIVINKKIPKVFGIDRIDFKKPVKIVEGPIDSLFLSNCLASVNASLVSTAEKLKSVLNKSSIVLVFDNECRNKEIVKMYADAIAAGYKIVIWPTSPDKKEDINDLVLAGKNPEKIIEQNTYSGLMAQIEYQKWKRI
jgi:hypothetical protein